MGIESRQLPADVKFRYQKDTRFQTLVDHGIGTELSTSGYCWAACLDMALSPFIPDEVVRNGIITDSVKDGRLGKDAFTEIGGLARDRIGDLVDVVNGRLLAQDFRARLKLIKGQPFDKFHLELQKGRTVIFGAQDKDGGHVWVMDRVYQDGGKYIYAAYDPAIEDPLEARTYFDNFQLYGYYMFSDTKILPFIISVGTEENQVIDIGQKGE